MGRTSSGWRTRRREQEGQRENRGRAGWGEASGRRMLVDCWGLGNAEDELGCRVEGGRMAGRGRWMKRGGSWQGDRTEEKTGRFQGKREERAGRSREKCRGRKKGQTKGRGYSWRVSGTCESMPGETDSNKAVQACSGGSPVAMRCGQSISDT
eukprot:766869-Hanusia_phi.AAC.2